MESALSFQLKRWHVFDHVSCRRGARAAKAPLFLLVQLHFRLVAIFTQS